MRSLRVLITFLIVTASVRTITVNAAPPPTQWEVTNTNDSGVGSLRWAMTNSNSDGTASRITFNIDTSTDPGCSLGGPCTIQPLTVLPFLNDLGSSGNTEINGYSQPGALQADGSGTAVIQIEIDGTSLAANNGFNVTTANNTIKGLAIHSFGYYGIAIYNPAADNNVIEGNHIGTTATGFDCQGNGTPGTTPYGGGILIENGAGNNVIGGSTAAERNIISCNEANGIDISDLSNSESTSGNQVLGNYIGDWALGPPDQGNDGAGVFIGHGAFDNTVGGSTAGARNLINGNGGDGIQLYGPNTTGNVIAGNYIGVNGDASIEVGNTGAGVNLIGGTHDNTVGGPSADDRNIISGNFNSGVRLANPATHANDIIGNYIGTAGTGGSALANGVAGVLIEDQAWGNTIGPDNLISGHLDPGVLIRGSALLNVIKTNYIGTNAAGSSALQNHYGVQIEEGANNNLIGGTTTADANLISGNLLDGIDISGADTDDNVILNNWIGVDATGSAPVANEVGVRITDGAQGNHVGQPSNGNLISGNAFSGVWVSGTGTSGNSISANQIGVNDAGSGALPNDVGVSIGLGAQDNFIGGSTTDAGNLISGNTQDGVRLWDAATTGNTISGNHIGVNSAGSAAIPNGGDGINLSDGTHHNTIGGDTTNERNIISGNSGYGVFLNDSGTDNNLILGNFIGSDSTGSAALANGSSGIALQNGPQFNVIGGVSSAEGNLISGNDNNGIYLNGSGTDNNTISANLIGVDASGSFPVGNGRSGIAILTGPMSNTIGGATPGERNVISGNDGEGIELLGTSSNVIQGNAIGTDASGVVSIGNGYRGVRIWNGSTDNIIGPDNIIAYNGFRGVNVDGVASTGNVITQNSIHSNLSGGIGLFDGGNNGIGAPTITSTSMSSVTISGGSSCPSCTVEVFSNTENEAQGRTYIGSDVTAGDGSWSLTVACISGEYLTATVTDPADGTSEFSSVFTSTVKCLFLPLIMK